MASSLPIPAISADLAMVARDTEGLGFSHVFSLFNISFSLGAFIGPIIAGQVLGHLGIEKGWYTMIGVSVAFYLICIPGILLHYRTKKSLLLDSDTIAAPVNSNSSVRED